MSEQVLRNSLRLNFLYADKYIFPSMWIYPRNRVPYSMLRLIQNGKARITIDGEEIVVQKNQILYVPQGCEMHCQALEDDFTFISIRFTAAIPLYDTELWPERLGIQKITECDEPEIHEYFERIVSAKTSSTAGKSFRMRGYLELIMAYLVDCGAGILSDAEAKLAEERYREQYKNRHLPNQIAQRNMKPELKMDTRIQSVVEYLIMHHDKSLNIQLLCEMVSLSESSLRRLFKEHTGKSPSEFINELRMMTAARRLLETDDRISDIASKVGYDDPNYFARMFKLNFGIAPRGYRSISRE
ncbi:AraC family transcriptional regulator [Paenibacillus oenotherae]|uniref:AraC family transcriptional regulator n=1 Tax=Paenibacillus oenotherae TaxID=1435645 RepID=A0ABS7D866_9BACL|nr:AraC family transcriptional regulator [Paenibacillus oenotherae]MBW7475746.1 AraC family transcriptional regulator [Paenibacillus oenotherae]